MVDEYKWYQLINDGSLFQGDILFKFPVIEQKDDLQLLEETDDVEIYIKNYDVIIMTQSCDIENDKLKDVILCPHWDINQAHEMDNSLKRTDLDAIKKGKFYRYLMLNKSELDEFPMGIRIVDFGRVFNVSKSFVSSYASKQTPRLRLLPPYREHLAQGFARFFMRVGLPQNIELE